MNDQKELQASLDRLSKNKDFLEHLDIIRDMREAALESMEGATTERVQQLAGAVTVYTAILKNAKAYAALKRRDALKAN